MVGISQSFSIEGTATEEEKEGYGGALLLDSKKPSTPNDPVDVCHPELEEISLSFTDSFLDFDFINGWFLEENSDPNMAELGTDSGVVQEGYVVVDKKDEVGKVLGTMDGPVCGLEFGKGENEVLEGCVGLRSAEGCEKDDGGDFGCLIGQQLEKFSLEGTDDYLIPFVASEENGENVGKGGSVVSGCAGSKMVNPVGDFSVANGNEQKINGTVGKNYESSSDGESESDGESSSDVVSESESSSSSGSSEGEEEDNNSGATNSETREKNEIGIEEGEIVLSDVEEMVGWSDNEDIEDDGSGSGAMGPVMSKNELKVLPPVPPVTVTLEPHHQTLPIGTILSIVGAQIIVEGVEKHNPLNEGSILWITESRLSLGIIDEIFGPVKNPYYVVRYNSETEIPAGIQQGTSTSFVPEFADHVLNDKSLYRKGYDASGDNDEELLDEMEFSDDEKEAEYKRVLKMKKRGTNEPKPGKRRKDKRPVKNQTGSWNKNRDKPPPVIEEQHTVPSVARQNMPADQPMAPPFWQSAQVPSFPPPSGIWSSGFQLQHPQNMGPPNGPPWRPQNQPNQLFQAPLPPNLLFQQQPMGTFPFPLNFGQANFGGGPWPIHPDQNMLNAMQFGGGGEQVVQQPQPQGFQTNPSAQNSSPATLGRPLNFDQSRGRNGGRRGQHRSRGRFGGGRGRYQSQ